MKFKQVNNATIDLFFLGGILVCAFCVKLFYANCETDQLKIFLKPVSMLVAFFSGANYQFSAEAGYFFPQLNIAIERSCSGVNFFVMAFCMVTISTLPFYKTIKNKFAAVLAWTLFVWITTIVANSSRILIAINSLRLSDWHPWLKTDKMHLAQGSFIYLTFLIALYFLAQYFLKKTKAYA